MKLRGPLAYYLDYVLFPIGIAAATWLDAGGFRQNPPSWIAIAVLGFLAFTYVEYWTHRSVLHDLLWHGQHERHHTNPEEYVVFPYLAVPIGFAAMYAASIWLLSSGAAWVGFSTGYLWFVTWHHVLHHRDLTGWPQFVQTYKTWHLRHHAGLPCNYGITVPFWDLLHGTSR